MDDRYFDAEVSLVRRLATEFALANPALAPFLDEMKNDPDVERLLEAVAFQNALLRRKLDNDFPQMIHELAQLILPHYLRQIPATTIIAFTPHDTGAETARIPAGTKLASAPVDGTRCRFVTTADLEFHQLELIDASFQRRQGEGGEIRLSLMLKGVSLQRWQPRGVRFFLGDDFAFASELYLLLSRHVTRILLTPLAGGETAVLPADCLEPIGFGEEERLFPYPSHAFPGYRLLQEYFSTPEKFLFFELNGWDRWRQRGDGMQFGISFELDRLPSQPQRIKRESFVLNAVPAVNLFTHDADPISVDHRAESYPVRPAAMSPSHCQLFSVDRVTGYSRATANERTYLPFGLWEGDRNEPTYHARFTQSLQHGGHDAHLSLAFPGDVPAAGSETLSIALTCSNGSLPEQLGIGDITEPLSALPSFVSARNVTPINPHQPPPLGPGVLAQLASHLYLNQVPLEQLEHLRRLLELYVFPGGRSVAKGAAHLKRIAAIEAVETTAIEQMVAGLPMRGRDIRIRAREGHFAGPGDLYLFGSVLDRFLGYYASQQSFTRLIFSDPSRGEVCQWPARLGEHHIR
jgi:type VI secretion system protein ImpG